MRDLSSAIEALREYRSEHDADWSDMEGRPTRCVCPTCRRTDVILAECEGTDLEDASLPRMPTSKRTVTLIEGIQVEQARVRELLKEYVGPSGMLGTIMLKQAIQHGDKAVASGDVVDMLAAHRELKECTG